MTEKPESERSEYSMGAYAVRDLHVWATDRECVRHVFRKMRPEVRVNSDPAIRNARKEAYRDALAQHHRHQCLVREFRF